jgi:hypothetical protein
MTAYADFRRYARDRSCTLPVGELDAAPDHALALDAGLNRAISPLWPAEGRLLGQTQTTIHLRAPRASLALDRANNLRSNSWTALAGIRCPSPVTAKEAGDSSETLPG